MLVGVELECCLESFVFARHVGGDGMADGAGVPNLLLLVTASYGTTWCLWKLLGSDVALACKRFDLA
jgi:hypothetical protein